MTERKEEGGQGSGEERLRNLFGYLTARHNTDKPLAPVPEELREWARSTSQMALVGISLGTYMQWKQERAAGALVAPTDAPSPAHAARYLAEAKTQRLIRLANRATSVGLRVGALSAAFFSTELLLRVYDGERRPRQTAWAGAGAGALYGLATNVGLPSGLGATRLISTVLAGSLGSLLGFCVGWVDRATDAWLPDDLKRQRQEQWRQLQDICEGRDMTPQAPPHPASDSMDVTAAVIASLEASLRKCARVSYRAFTAETSESLSDLPEPETVGWGATKMSDMLQEKGPEAGAWLWVSRDDHVIDAVRKMTKANVGSLLVFDPSKIEEPKGTDKILHASREAVVGIFTERDYMTKIAVQGRSSRDTKISEVMTPNPITVTPKHSVLDVMELMINKNFRHVPVVDEGRLLGMASMRDVVHVMLKEHREEVGRLQEYIQGTF